MAFRNDGEAARARADALAAELAERDAELEALKAELARKDEALRAKEAKLRDVEEEASPILEAAERAEAALDDLKKRGEERKKSKEEEKARQETAEAKRKRIEGEQRRLASVSVLGKVDIGELAPSLLIPAGVGAFFVGTSMGKRWAAAFAVGSLLALVACKYLGREWSRYRWQQEEEWAKSRPYVLEGYPELLGKQPRSSVHSPIHLGGEHQVLEVVLSVRGGPIPTDLVEVITGFDATLSTTNPQHDSPFYGLERRMHGDFSKPEPKPNVFYRRSPITTENASSVADHNRAVRKWVRRFEREVLAPLHRRYGLARVRLRLL